MGFATLITCVGTLLALRQIEVGSEMTIWNGIHFGVRFFGSVVWMLVGAMQIFYVLLEEKADGDFMWPPSICWALGILAIGCQIAWLQGPVGFIAIVAGLYLIIAGIGLHAEKVRQRPLTVKLENQAARAARRRDRNRDKANKAMLAL